MIETIVLAILAVAPAVTSIFSIIIAVCKLKKNFNELKGEVINTKEYETLKNELAKAHKENAEIKILLKEYLTKIDRIKRD